MYGQNKFDNKLDVKGKLNKSGGIPVQDDSGIAPVGGLIIPPHVTAGFWDCAVPSGDGYNFADADVYTESATQLFPLGTKLDLGDRVFRYAQMGGAVTAGKVLQQKANIIAHHSQMTGTAAISADSDAATTDISVETQGDTDITANQYKDGYLWVNDADGEGQSWRVKSHPAHDHSSDASIVITVYGGVATALATGSELGICQNVYKDVIVSPGGAATGCVVGITNVHMQNDYYGWIQVRGPKAVLAGETLVLGMSVMASDADAGAAMPDNSDDLEKELGSVMAGTVVDAEYGLIYLTIE